MLELKRYDFVTFLCGHIPFNRTMLELKKYAIAGVLTHTGAFNRTMLELKTGNDLWCET